MIVRETYLKQIRGFYKSDLIKVLVGIRRCGKSVILQQIIDELKSNKIANDKHIIYLNFEYVENEHLQEYKALNEFIKNKIVDSKTYYVFLDEIQNVNKFEKVVNSLRASIPNISIFITGSNSKLLSEELSSMLSGRYVLFNINPLSYSEYISLTKKDAADEKNFWDYAKWGGLPNRCEFNNEDDIKKYLYSVYDSIILRDIIERLNLKDTILFDKILQYILDTEGREFSSKNIIQYINTEYKKISSETLYKYIDALTKAFILRKVYRYDIHGKRILKTLNKFYVADLGIAQIKNNNPNFNNYVVLENIVYNELLFKGYKVYVGKTKKGEIDFLTEKDGQKKYIQVAYKIEGDNFKKTSKREFGAFDFVDDHSPKYVLSIDKTNLSQNGITHMNIIDFLINEDF